MLLHILNFFIEINKLIRAGRYDMSKVKPNKVDSANAFSLSIPKINIPEIVDVSLIPQPPIETGIWVIKKTIKKTKENCMNVNPISSDIPRKMKTNKRVICPNSETK